MQTSNVKLEVKWEQIQQNQKLSMSDGGGIGNGTKRINVIDVKRRQNLEHEKEFSFAHEIWGGITNESREGILRSTICIQQFLIFISNVVDVRQKWIWNRKRVHLICPELLTWVGRKIQGQRFLSNRFRGRFYSKTIAFWTGHSVARYICSLAPLTPLTPLTCSIHGPAHSLRSLPCG